MTAPATLIRSAATAFAVTLALAGCGASVDPEPSGPAPILVQPSLPSVASGVAQEGVPLPINITITNGEITGANATIDVRRNTPVRLTVLADVADRLLVKGYGLRTQVTVGRPVQLSFIADRAGTYDVVLEDAGTRLTRLVVG